MDEKNVNEELHRMSIHLARMWHDDKQHHYINNDQHDSIMEAYIHVRRAITKGEDGKRYGARQAYHAMQGEWDKVGPIQSYPTHHLTH